METFRIENWSGQYRTVLLLLCILLFPLAVGSVHLFDWDEVNFAEASREMLVNNNFMNVQINYLPFWEKPPLFFWLQVVCMKLVGVNEWGSRLPNVAVGIVSVLFIYSIGKKVVSKKFGFIWGLAYIGSFLPHFYFKSGIIDPLFNLFIFLALYYFYLYQENYQKKHVITAAVLSGLAVLTKGPVGVLIIFLVVVVYIVANWKTIKLKFIDILLVVLIILGITAIWFIAEIINGGGISVFKEFIDYQVRLFTTSEAGHGQPFYYHFIVLFFGCFPISLIAFPYLLRKKFGVQTQPMVQNFYLLNFILFWVVLLLFSFTTTKIVHYSSLCYFPLSFIAAYVLYQKTNANRPISTVSFVLIAVVGVLISILFTALPLVVRFKNEIIPFINDPFAVANITMPVAWSGYEFLIGICYFLVFVYILFLLKKNTHYIAHFFILNAVMLNVLMIFIVPKVEQHVQGSLIEFFEKHQDSNEYMVTYGFRSYAQYFYTKKQNPTNPLAKNDQWLYAGAIDKPTYIVCKIMNKEQVELLEGTHYLYEKGGFAFFVRHPKTVK